MWLVIGLIVGAGVFWLASWMRVQEYGLHMV